MGIGIWSEMQISNPVAYLFKNADPRGSLRANVSSATVRCLSNMRLANMLENRHAMSQAVRETGWRTCGANHRNVSGKSAGIVAAAAAKMP